MIRAIAALVVAVLVLFAPPAAAQSAPVNVRSELDRAAMTIGDQALLPVIVELARGYDLLDPGVPRAVGDLEVVDTLTVLQSRLPSGTTRVQLRYLVSAFSLGPKVVPVIVVGYRAPDGSTGRAQTQGPLAVEIQSVIAPGEEVFDIRPLKPPLPVGAADSGLARSAAAVAIAVAALALVVVLVIRLTRRGGVLAPAPVLHGAARRALTEIEEVAELRLPEQGRTREHYDRVAAAVRRFIDGRYGIGAASRTARELRKELERVRVDRSQAQLLCEVLADAESIRYEERVIYPARAQKTMRDLTELLRKTVVAEEYELISTGATA
jgi:hypothetical protein